MQGYTGAQPSPMIINPAIAVTVNGSAMHATPASAMLTPSRIILLSPSLSDIKPDKNLPVVIPIKNSEPYAAAFSLLIPLVPSR